MVDSSSDSSQEASAPDGRDLADTDSDLLRLARRMMRIRAVSVMLAHLEREGEIGVPLARAGTEAVFAAVALGARSNDWLFAEDAALPLAVARDVPLEAVFHHAFGNAQDPSVGHARPGRLSLRAARIVAAGGSSGAHTTFATGVAWAARLKNDDVVSVAVADARTLRGAEIHNGLNFAGVFRVPAVFVCVAPEADLQGRALAYGLASARCSAEDPLQVLEAVRAGVTRAAAGEGPLLVEAVQRSDEASDDLELLERLVQERGLGAGIASLPAQIAEELEAAVAAARAASAPGRTSMFQHVHADHTWNLREQAADGEGEQGMTAQTLNLVQAINDALRLEMRRDPRVVVLGEDVGRVGGVFRVTQGLHEEFGEDRVIDTPLSEGGIIGAAIGMALYGLVPVPEIQFADFIFPAYDQIVSELAKLRYRSGGEYPAKMVIRTPVGGGIRGGLYHSQSPEALFIHVAGLKVVCPSNPRDAKGLLLASIRDPDPVLFFEPKRVYRAAKGEVPDGDYTVELGKAAVAREGTGVTVVAWGAMLYEALAAADDAAKEGVSCEVIDLRTLWPVDIDTIVASVVKTGRVVVVHEAPRTCGFGAELIALINERAFLHLEAPPVRVTGFDTPFPYTLEMDYLPLAHRILGAVRTTARY